MQKKMTTDLFRFVTLRAPQLISAERRALGFIEHPDPSNSVFLSTLLGASEDINVRRAALIGQVGTFKPTAFEGVSDVKAISPELWEFSLWLAENKNKLERDKLDAQIPASLPNSSKIIKLWDNLFYDILTKENAPLRQACLQMIVAINFINNYATYSPGTTLDKAEQEEEAQLLKRLADGKVIVDRAFTIEKSDVLSAPVGFANKSYARNEATHKAHLAHLNVNPLKAIRKEFCMLNKQYEAERTAAYDAQYPTYKKQVKTIVNDYISRNNIQGEDIESQLPFGLVEPFVLSFDAPLSSKYTQGKLSDEALAYMNDHCASDTQIRQVTARLDKDIRNLEKTATPRSGRKVSEVLIKGVATRSSASVHHDYTFSTQEVKGPNGAGSMIDVYLTITTQFSGDFIKKPNFTLTVGNTDHSYTDLDIISTDHKSVFAKISFGTLSKISRNQEFVLNGSFELSNGKSMTFTRTALGGVSCFSGTLYALRNNSGQVELYGVNRIGVADYRKVEQELCCYVAGEVSHIENILAKEYKEKETRQLTRTETSIEARTESEAETLSDTTTTTRHEMSTEISDVINKDRQANLGFSAGANGKYPKVNWHANVNGNFAFGNSTSNSNSEARTYAEDVTRRALERIVQKTSMVRTSKVIREFEENNKHGFDNREGEKHVTGIYRWVDKVYKNRIVNYGKRLMYEFIVPEPAKFYKEAIILEAEEEEITSSEVASNGNRAVKPVHPKENGIPDANAITRDNYLEKLSLYGAEASDPMPAVKEVSQPYAESIGTGDGVNTYNYLDKMLQVPLMYKCTRIYGVLGGHYKAKFGHSAYFKLSAGGNWQVTGLEGEGILASAPGVDLNINITGLNLEGSINVTINTRKIVAFNTTLTAYCELDESEENRWKQEVFKAIMSKYEQQMRAYKDAEDTAKAEANATQEVAEQEQESLSNSGFNADIIMTELKRLCIEMITQPFGIDQGKDFYKTGACEIPTLHLTEELDNYSSYVKFFEQAFDWEIMSSIFYPYYWAKKCDWKTLFQSNDGNDHVFRSFLRSGMGRVVVPVREGYEDAVTYFMETGEIWNGIGLAIDTDDELYLSIMDETTQLEGRVEGQEWETVVPSTLTIVQARSALLDDEGLPCCETDADVIATLNVKADTTTLTGKSDPTTTTTA